MRLHAQCPQLDTEPMGKGSLARRRRTCDHDKFFLRPACDHLRDLADLFLLQSLLDQDQVIGVASGDIVVEGSHISDAQLLAPGRRLSQHSEQLLAGFKGRHLSGIFHGREHQNKSAAVQYQVKVADISCVLGHVAVKIILESSDTVQIHSGRHAVFEQTGLVIHPVAFK